MVEAIKKNDFHILLLYDTYNILYTRNILLFLGLYIPIPIIGTRIFILLIAAFKFDSAHLIATKVGLPFLPELMGSLTELCCTSRWGALHGGWDFLVRQKTSCHLRMILTCWPGTTEVWIFYYFDFNVFKNYSFLENARTSKETRGWLEIVFFFSGAWIFLIGVFQLFYGVRPNCPSDDVMALFFGKGLEWSVMNQQVVHIVTTPYILKVTFSLHVFGVVLAWLKCHKTVFRLDAIGVGDLWAEQFFFNEENPSTTKWAQKTSHK